MLDIVLWILVGAFIGWHIPEPTWARIIKEKALSFFSKSK